MCDLIKKRIGKIFRFYGDDSKWIWKELEPDDEKWFEQISGDTEQSRTKEEWAELSYYTC